MHPAAPGGGPPWQHGDCTQDGVIRSPSQAAPAAAALTGLLLVLLAAACGPTARPPQPAESEARRQRQAREQEQCLQQRRRLQTLIEAFERSQARVVAVAEDTYRPSAAPAPLDPEEQRRLAIYDQEMEQEQYERAVADWEAQEQERRGRWRSERAVLLEQARSGRAAAAAALRRAFPTVVSDTDPPQLVAAERERRLRCGVPST